MGELYDDYLDEKRIEADEKRIRLKKERIRLKRNKERNKNAPLCPACRTKMYWYDSGEPFGPNGYKCPNCSGSITWELYWKQLSLLSILFITIGFYLLYIGCYTGFIVELLVAIVAWFLIALYRVKLEGEIERGEREPIKKKDKKPDKENKEEILTKNYERKLKL